MFNAEAFKQIAIERSNAHKTFMTSSGTTRTYTFPKLSMSDGGAILNTEKSNITFTKIDAERKVTVVSNEDDCQWKNEKRALHSLLYFNTLIIAYNLTFALYSTLVLIYA